MDHDQEIARLEGELADSERYVKASAETRARIEAYRRNQEAEARAVAATHEAEETRRALSEAQTEERRAEAVPFREAVADVDQRLAALEQEVRDYVDDALADARAFYRRYRALLAERAAARTEIATRVGECAVGIDAVPMHDFESFVLIRLARLEGRSRPASGSLWAQGVDW